MFNENDIYSHLVNGGNTKELYKALEIEINNAQNRIIKEKEVELKQKELREKKNKAADAALKALIDYCNAAGVEYTKDNLAYLIKLLGGNKIKFGNNSLSLFDVWPF